MSDLRPDCSYGTGCYRRNPDHFLQYKHSHVEALLADPSSSSSTNLSPLIRTQLQIIQKLVDTGKIAIAQVLGDTELDEKKIDPPKRSPLSAQPPVMTPDVEPPSKKVKVEEPSEVKLLRDKGDSLLNDSGSETVMGKWKAAAPFHLFLSKISNVPETHHEPLTLTFSDTLDPSLGVLEESVQINYMCDPGWLLAQYCVHKLQRTPITVFYGAENPDMEVVSGKVPTLTAVRLKPKYLFGQHHTKMSLLYYQDRSVRIIVHTGNLYDSDWEDRTQGMWISPKCEVTENPADSVTHFRKDLLEYLKTYEQPSLLGKWMDRLRKVNMSEIRVAFLGSVPGNHTDKSFGHPRLSTLLRLHTPEASKISGDWMTVAQCSSIGSLGPLPSSWFQGEFAAALGTTGNQGPSLGSGKAPEIQLIYPSHSDVRQSLHGLLGGGCLPYSKKTHSTQLWLTGYMNHWKCDQRFRTKAMPHIKSYTRLSADGSKALWFVLSSANVSKAAWGMRNKAGNLTIQAWEAGVLFLPKFFNLGNHFTCNYSGVNLSDEIPLHYDIPLQQYSDSDTPFLIDSLR